MIRTTIELTIEDIEILLDVLGVETSYEHHNKTELRNKLHEILLSLREKHANANMA